MVIGKKNEKKKLILKNINEESFSVKLKKVLKLLCFTIFLAYLVYFQL